MQTYIDLIVQRSLEEAETLPVGFQLIRPESPSASTPDARYQGLDGQVYDIQRAELTLQKHAMNAASRIIFPIHTKHHWSAGIIDIERAQIVVYDSGVLSQQELLEEAKVSPRKVAGTPRKYLLTFIEALTECPRTMVAQIR